MEELVDAMATVCGYDVAVFGFGVLFDHVSWVAEFHAGFDELDGLVEAFAGSFDYAYGVGIG